MDESKTARINIRLTPTEKQRIKAAAEKASMDITTYILKQVFRDCS